MDFYILISPRDTQYIVIGALLYGFFSFFSVSRIHCYGKKKLLIRVRAMVTKLAAV